MHEREESTRKLACNVDILLQQQALRQGEIENPNEVSKMSRREILKTASNVVKGFNEMRQQLLNMDLKVDEGRQQNSGLPETKWQKALKSSKVTQNTHKRASKTSKPAQIPVKPFSQVSSEVCEQKHEGIAFEIPFESSAKCKKKPAIVSLQKDLKQESQEMVALKLEEKQRKAAERRQVCTCYTTVSEQEKLHQIYFVLQKKQEDRIRKTRESREALMELQTKVNIFRQHQAALDGQADPDLRLSENEAACLAHDIADGFSTIHGRYKKDLERAEGFLTVYDKVMS
jgi:hypothetical protein